MALLRLTAAPLAGGELAVGTDAGKVVVLDSAGKPRCTFDIPAAAGGKANGVTTALIPSAAGDRVYFASVENRWAITADCKGHWSKTVSGLFHGSAPALDEAGGRLHVGAYGGYASPPALQVRELKTGALLGSAPLSSKNNEGVSSPPALSDDGKTVYIGSSDKSLYALDVRKASAPLKAWSFATGGVVDTRALVTADRVYVAGFDGFVHALKPQSGGQVLGQLKVGRLLFSSPVTVGQTVFVAATAPAKVFGLSATLKPLWTFTPAGSGGAVQLRASPVVAGGRLFVGSTGGTLYPLDVSDATP